VKAAGAEAELLSFTFVLSFSCPLLSPLFFDDHSIVSDVSNCHLPSIQDSISLIVSNIPVLAGSYVTVDDDELDQVSTFTKMSFIHHWDSTRIYTQEEHEGRGGGGRISLVLKSRGVTDTTTTASTTRSIGEVERGDGCTDKGEGEGRREESSRMRMLSLDRRKDQKQLRTQTVTFVGGEP
jgi:hypothetical protein